MTLYRGTDRVKWAYLGNNEIEKIYIDNDLVFRRAPRKTQVFYDSGLSGSANPNYTNLGGAIRTVESNGTKIHSNTYADGIARPNQLLSGDWEVEFTFVEGGNIYYPDIAFFTENSGQYVVQFTIDHRQEEGTENIGYVVTAGGQQSVQLGSIRNGEVWKITRYDGVIKMYVDDNLYFTIQGVISAPMYFGFKTHSHAGRWYRFRDLRMYMYQ